MEENKFEKQVQQKMDELKIQPSDSVWKNIEVRIEKKKRSKWGFLFLLFCTFLSAGIWLWNTGGHSVLESKNSVKTGSEKSTIKFSANENKSNQIKTDVNPDSINKKNNEEKNSVVNKNGNKNSSQHYKISSGTKINLKINSGEIAAIDLSKQKEVKKGISENTETKSGIFQQKEIQSQNEKIIDETKDSSYNKLNKDSLLTLISLQNEITKEKDTSKQVLATSKTLKHLKKNKWKAGILFSAGISGVENNFPGLVNSSAYANDPGSNVSGSTPVAIPSQIKSGFGFMTGLIEEKNISQKTKFVSGINFKSFNTKNKVGSRNATTGNYNTQNSVNRYNNYYNFIELPVALKIQIGKGKIIPLFWQGGFVISELISSNALQFNQSSGLYYTDNSIFNKTQIGLNTSISATLFSKQKNSILIGPYFYYDASKIASEGLYNKKHFIFTGLRTEIIFGK